jgi:hypothetical protein
VGTVLLRIVKNEALLQMLAGWGQLANGDQRVPERHMSRQKEF